MKKYILIYIFIYLFISTNCGRKNENLHNNITFINNSNYSLFVYGDFWYPDTSINFGNPMLAGEYYRVFANSSADPLKIRDTYEGRFKQYEKLMIFVFDANILETNPWDSVKSKYLILKRFDYSLDDLDKMNWTINYP